MIQILDTISGLRLGADDYLSKDTSMPHILARIAALFRRIQALQTSAGDEQIKHGCIVDRCTALSDRMEGSCC